MLWGPPEQIQADALTVPVLEIVVAATAPEEWSLGSSAGDQIPSGEGSLTEQGVAASSWSSCSGIAGPEVSQHPQRALGCTAHGRPQDSLGPRSLCLIYVPAQNFPPKHRSQLNGAPS